MRNCLGCDGEIIAGPARVQLLPELWRVRLWVFTASSLPTQARAAGVASGSRACWETHWLRGGRNENTGLLLTPSSRGLPGGSGGPACWETRGWPARLRASSLPLPAARRRVAPAAPRAGRLEAG